MRWWLPPLMASVLWATPAVAGPDGPIHERLILALRDDSSVKLRALAAKRLGEIDAPDAARTIDDALIAGLGDAEPLVRSMSARSLGARQSVIALPRLRTTLNSDSDPLVREEAKRASQAIRSAEAAAIARSHGTGPRSGPERRRTVELGTIAVEGGAELTGVERDDLAAGVRDLVETQLEPHLPAMFPREDPGYRFDVRVKRARVRTDRKVEIRCEVSIVILELPEAHLRHATQGVASGTSKAKGPKQLSTLEARVAKEATNAAVKEALALLTN